MIADDLPIVGSLLVQTFDSSGLLKEERSIPNLVVTSGLNLIATGLASGTLTVPSHMAVGTSSTSAALSQTTLGTEVGRVALTSTTRTGSAVAYVGTYPAGTGTGALTEAGIFNDPTTGTMLSRSTFSVVNKLADDSMVITWTITIG